MIDTKFLDKIDNPQDGNLQDLLNKAIDNCRERLEREDKSYSVDVARKSASTFYYNWKGDRNPRYVFLVQNPGNLQRDRHFGREMEESKESSSPIEKVQVNRKYLKTWLLRKNEDFSKNFFLMLKEFGLIDFSGKWEEYIQSGNLFQDFYFTDLVKYRVETERIKEKEGGNGDTSFKEYLKEEINFIEPSLMLVFGRRPWIIIRRRMNAEHIGKKKFEGNEKSITNVHGHLFKTDKLIETYLIPLAHFSGRNQFLRNSYFDYLKEGLNRWRENQRRKGLTE